MLLFVLLAILSPAYAATELRYNAGGYAIGNYSTDPSAFVLGPKSLYYRGPSLADLTVGRSHRWAEDTGFIYEFPVGNGQFDIDLIFAEIFTPTQKVGKRKFNVYIEDKIELEEFDVFAEAGANKELTKTFTKINVDDGKVSIAFKRGSIENPMVSGIRLRRTDKKDISIGDVIDTEGTGKKKEPIKNKGFDHQAHAVAGGPYEETDYNDNQKAEVTLDGSLSHSHFFDPDNGETGRIVKYVWQDDKGKVIGTDQIVKVTLPVGKHTISLTVTDQLDDVAKAKTEVLIKPATSSGAYCYYYKDTDKLSISLNSREKPVEGYSTNIISFQEDEFQYSDKSSTTGTSNWAMRCVADFYSTNTTTYKFTVKFRGKGATLFVNGGQKATRTTTSTALQTISADVVLGIGRVPIQVMYYAGTDNPVVSFEADGVVAPPNVLSYKAAEVYPTISSISPAILRPEGGGILTVTGTGFFNKLSAQVGTLNMTGTLQKISGTELVLKKAPKQDDAGGDSTVPITVTNAAGTSNTVNLQYKDGAAETVAWEQSHFRTSGDQLYSIKQLTGVKVGPDQNYYMSSLAGVVYRLKVGRDLKVQDSCKSPTVNRPILGLAFDYGADDLQLYVSTSSLYWFFGGKFKDQVDGWANGAIERFKSGCDCLCYDRKVVTGLPVSNHDHGVNAVLVKDGNLYIANGGATNAGHNTPGNKLGGWPESPLSAAILVANLRKPGFDGKVKYDQYDNPETAKQTSGDVEVYASGIRNCFGMTMRMNGEIWASDNGGNPGYGDRSTGCGQDDKEPFGAKQNDLIYNVKKGKFYGHPNRARGQCSRNGLEKPVIEMVSSTSGIVEYSSNAFQDSLRTRMIFTKYAASGSGRTEHEVVDGDKPFSTKRMTDYSGLSVENGLFGELVMPRVQQGFVAVLKPIISYSGNKPFLISVSPNRGKAGKKVLVTGEKFGAGAKVNFGSLAAGNVKVKNANEIECTVPNTPGKKPELVAVTVTVGSSKADGFVQFRYEG